MAKLIRTGLEASKDLRDNLRALGSSYDTLSQMEESISLFAEWEQDVPQFGVYRRFLQLRKRHICQQIEYFESGYPRIKTQIEEYAKRKQEESRQQVEKMLETCRSSSIDSHPDIMMNDSQTVTTQQAEQQQDELYHISRPVWTRRWSAWIEPSWKQKQHDTTNHRRHRPWPCRHPLTRPVESDKEHTSMSFSPTLQLVHRSPAKLRGSSFDACARHLDSRCTPSTGNRTPDSSLETLRSTVTPSGIQTSDSSSLRETRTMSANINTSQIEKRSSFVKVRKNRYGRSPSTVATMEHPSGLPLVLTRQETSQADNEKKNEQDKKPEADRLGFRHAILSEVETDIDAITDYGVDTDTDVEGRPATRCLIFDPMDGLPHPFWGVEVEQSSWVSIPNPSKLDPECKVLHMLRLLKPEAYPKYNSVLLVRHYKPFLKYGMFPDSIFELWGREPKKLEFMKPEAEEREELRRIEKYPPSEDGEDPNRFSADFLNIAGGGSNIDVAWIRKEATKFQQNIIKHGRQPPTPRIITPGDQDDLYVQCPIDPTWRNVYSSRVRILKRAPKRKMADVLAQSDGVKSPNRLQRPVIRASTMKGSMSYQQVPSGKRFRLSSRENSRRTTSPISSSEQSIDGNLPLTSSLRVVQDLSKVESMANICGRGIEGQKQPHLVNSTSKLKKVSSDPDARELIKISKIRKKEQRFKDYVISKKKKETVMPKVVQHQSSDVSVNRSELKHLNSFEAQYHLDDSTPLPLHQTHPEIHRLKNLAIKRRVELRPKLKARKGRRVISHHEGVLTEGQAWLRFHQIRDLRTRDNWPGVPPSPVPAPSSICVPTRGARKGLNKTPQWPTFISTIFRGPGQYEDLQETLLHILWSMRNSKRHLPSPQTKSLKVWIGGYMIPHDEKRFRYGDDSWFGSEPLMAFGVCDGVGEMSDTPWRVAGFDCRGFGEDILREAKARFQTIRTSITPLRCTRPRLVLPSGGQRSDRVWEAVEFEVHAKSDPPSLMALESLVSGFYGKTTTWGAATCLIGCLNDSGNKVGFANIGDSRAIVLRRGQFSTGPLHIVGSTTPEQHGWNLPVQLARLPDRNRVRTMRDDPRLAQLVKTLDQCRATGQDINDPAETATLFDFDLQEGDLIVLATDGLWDNVFDDEIAALCGISLSPLEAEWVTGSIFMSTAPRDIAKGLCLAAYWKSIQYSCETPFTQAVRESGGTGYGGKPDDITVMAVWVVPSKNENTNALLHQCQLERKLKRQQTHEHDDSRKFECITSSDSTL